MTVKQNDNVQAAKPQWAESRAVPNVIIFYIQSFYWGFLMKLWMSVTIFYDVITRTNPPKKINPNKVLNLSQVTHQKKWVSLLSMLWMKLWTIWYSPGKTLESSIKLRRGAAQSGEQMSHRFIFSLPAISVRFTLPETNSTKSWVQERSCIYRIISTLVQHTVEGTACIPHRAGSCAQSAVKH